MEQPGAPLTVLIAEDDRNTAALVATYLEREGFRTLIVHGGKEALEAVRRENPGFIVLDIMLPQMDGWEVCRRVRRFSDVPILMLTARVEEIDRVAGLSLGADDYVVKPFSPRELVERVKAILRRARPAGGGRGGNGILSHKGLTLDPQKRKATLNGRTLSLTASEYKLLLKLMEAPGRVFTRDELLSVFYEHGEAVVDRVIDVHINKLRQKIEEDSAAPRHILTARGFGYRFADADEELSE